MITYGADLIRIGDSGVRNATIDSLDSCTEYDITVSIQNKDYEGPMSDVVKATTGKLISSVLSVVLFDVMTFHIKKDFYQRTCLRVKDQFFVLSA